MKYLIILFLLLTSCTKMQKCADEEHTQKTINNTKTIAAKKEQVGSYWNPLTNKQVIETQYIFVATDGTWTKVKIGDYMRYNIGDIYECTYYWKY